MSDYGSDYGLVIQQVRRVGIIPTAEIPMNAVTPANNDTVTIGGHVFVFKAALGAAGASTQILQTGTQLAVMTRAANAVNGVSDAGVVQATTPFAGLVVASFQNSVSYKPLRLQLADARGGNRVADASGSLTLASSITAGRTWNVANLNAAGGQVPKQVYLVEGVLTVTAAMIAQTEGFQLGLPDVLGSSTVWETLVVSVSRSGVPKTVDDKILVTNNSVSAGYFLEILPQAGSVPLVAGDVIHFSIYSS